MKHLRTIFVLFILLALTLAVLPANSVSAAGTCYLDVDAVGANDGSSWADAYTDLQSALGASSCTEVWVAAGTYKPTTGTDRTATFQLKNGVALYGGFAGTESNRADCNPADHVTILSGDIDGNDINNDGNFLAETTADIVGNNAYHVVTSIAVDSTAVLDGFKITAGLANGGHPELGDYTDDHGGGMYNDGSSPTLANLTFSGNRAIEPGGGMFNYNNSNPTLTEAAFSGNSAAFGGGMGNIDSSPSLMNATFNGNDATYNGGGMYNSGGSPVLTNVIFISNNAESGGGMGNDGGGNPILTNVTFTSNNATTYYGGGMYNSGGSPILTNVNFISNTASSGGGMYHSGGNPILTNVILSGNTATNYGGGMCNINSNPTLMSIAFSDNTAKSGGGMFNNHGNPTLTSITFISNIVTMDGGGLYNDNNSNPVLTDITFSGNAAVHGGGMYNYNNSNPTLTNVTFSSNTASSLGGGIENRYSSPILMNVTFSGNTNSGMDNDNSNPSLTNVTFSDNNGYGIYNYDSNPTLKNTLIANNASGDCMGSLNAASSNNLIKDSTNACGLINGVNGNIVGQDPILGPLHDNGGATKTYALLVGSPAIDAGTNAGCSAGDQRGIARPIDGDNNGTATCDIGSYEYLPPNAPPTDITLSNNTVAENQPAFTSVGVFTTTDPDAGDTHTYSFCGGADDGAFVIGMVGIDSLHTLASFDYETKNAYNICLRTDDGNGGTFDKAFTINVTDIFEGTSTFRSMGDYDGWVLEFGENTTAGGMLDSAATTFRLGDDTAKKQYRGILSFSTGAGLPDTAVITKVTLKVKKQGITGGGNPVTTFQGFMLDIKKGFFGTAALQTSDFQAAAHKTYGPFMTALGGGWYSIDLTPGKGYINKLSSLSGLTQIRLRFKLDDNNNTVANYLSLFSGNAPAASRPQLIIEYYVP